MLSDRRLSLNHNTMEDLLLIKANHHAWEELECEEILEDALKVFFMKRRKRVTDDSPKKRKLSEVNPYQQISDSEESTSSSNSDSSGSESEDESATYPDDGTSDDSSF